MSRRASPSKQEIAAPITLTVRARTERLRDRIIHAHDAGFEWFQCEIALLDGDTRAVIAEMVVDHGKESFGELRSIEIRIDPERCAVEWLAGTRLMRVCADFAQRMGADLCNSDGQPLTDAASKALAERINTVMQRRIDAAVPPRVRQPDGTFKSTIDLSFTTVTYAADGEVLASNHFDVEPLEWHEGQIQGYRLAGELLDFKRAHHRAFVPIFLMMADAGAALPSRNAKKKSTGNVAFGFLKALSEMVSYSAQKSNYPAYIGREIAQVESMRQTSKADALEKAAFVERMRTARAAKRAARVGGAA